MVKRKSKEALVISTSPDGYRLSDIRLRKPIWYQKKENGQLVGSGLFQELDEIVIEKRKLTYFQPNNISLLLSISRKHLSDAKTFLADKFYNKTSEIDYERYDGRKVEFIESKSKDICDYIELIATAIVFSYTSLEAFANISITDDYRYKFKNKKTKIEEIYNKQEIERWVVLREKLCKILPEIYRVNRPTLKKWWNKFIQLENYRHAIVHQKSIDSTEFYKKYFEKEIFEICETPELIIKYFYEETAKNKRTHIMWPWLNSEIKEFPISFNYDEKNFEITGNLWDPKSKDKRK